MPESNEGSVTRILLCEDNLEIAALLETILGSDVALVSVARSVAEVKEQVVNWTPDVILLDLLYPETDGAELQLLTDVRNLTSKPIVVISGWGRTSKRVQALREGADDFITKPFDPEEVRARITAVLRRGRLPRRNEGLLVDDIRKEAVVGDRRVLLSPKEYLLLSLLASARGRPVSSRDIMAKLWPGPTESPPTNQDVQKYVYLLRRKVEDDPARPRFIETLRGVGYRLAI